MIFITSDTHFGHANIIKYSARPFSDVKHMDNELILRWNSVVDKNDDVYHLGDFGFYSSQQDYFNVLDSLNGRIHLVLGNHDQVIKKNHQLQKKFASIRDYVELKTDEGLVVLSHFPMIVWNKSHRGSFMFHGHSHGSLKYPFTGRIKDVGTDTNDYFPYELMDVVGKLKNIPVQELDHH